MLISIWYGFAEMGETRAKTKAGIRQLSRAQLPNAERPYRWRRNALVAVMSPVALLRNEKGGLGPPFTKFDSSLPVADIHRNLETKAHVYVCRGFPNHANILISGRQTLDYSCDNFKFVKSSAAILDKLKEIRRKSLKLLREIWTL